MRQLGFLLVTVYNVGFLASWFVYYFRTGFSRVRAEYGVDWREFVLVNPIFFVFYVVRAFLWPIPFVAWLAKGRPPSPWHAIVHDGKREVRAIVRLTATEGQGSSAAGR